MLSEQKAKHKRWLKDWKEGLASCNECDNEYTNSQTAVIDGQNYCPHCRTSEDKRYYYCPEDGSKGCECKWH